MSNKNLISQHVLWDNLKRAANIHLREIAALPLSERVKVFEFAPYEKIQKLLTTIGKELYRIVLHQVIKDELEKTGKEYSIQFVDDVLADFSFFFFPGYTTLDRNKRVFIEGLRISGYNKQRKFFSGIGYKNIRFHEKVIKNNNLSQFNQFLLGHSKDQRKLFKYKGSIYYNDNPTTMAYNLALNKFYFSNEYPKHELPFQAGSTHFWKSQQIYEGKYFPFKLKNDLSELRTLHIGIQTTKENPIQYGDNKISLLLKKNKLHTAGETIAYHLSKEIIPIQWVQPFHKDAYTDWCINSASPVSLHNKEVDMEKMQLAQKKVYSYWLNATFNGQLKHNSAIQQDLKNSGYDYIADNRIKSYKEYIQEEPQYEKHIYETYFSNWYTLFLESYNPSANLGTIMLFTKHRLSPAFLSTCNNFIKSIYNELRLAEALALRQKKDFRSINHHHNKIINAFRYYVEEISENDAYFSRDIINYYINLIEGFMNVEEMIQTQPTGLMKRTSLNLVDEVNRMVAVYRFFTRNYNRFAYLLGKLKVDETHFDAYIDLQFLEVQIPDNIDEYAITYYAPILQLLLKDLVENVIVHAKLGSPRAEILFHKNEDSITLEFRTNIWPTQRILNKMDQNSFGELSSGWATIHNVINTANAFSDDVSLNIDLPQTIAKDKTSLFWIKLNLKNGNNQ